MRIKIQDLQTVTEKIFNHLKDINIESIDLEMDYYWEIAEENLYNIEQEPAQHVVGQLSDDWTGLQKLLNDVNTPLAYDLVGLASILRAIGRITLG